MRSKAVAESGARPRLVWMITPVALITGLSDADASADNDASTRVSIQQAASSCDAGALSPDIIDDRSDSAAWRAAAVTMTRPYCSLTRFSCGRWRNSSIDGMRSNAGIGCGVRGERIAS